MSVDAETEAALDVLARGVVDRDPRALARSLSVIERQDARAARLLGTLLPVTSTAPVFGLTGSPGVGKSSLLSACISAWRNAGRTVAVAAVDPSSPISGGAILGDRLRMHRHATDPGVFIRSVSSRGSVGGLAESVFGVAATMLAGGWDIVVIETVGAGQAEIDIIDLADVTVVVTAPGLGDEIQALKAGILEIADVLVVNKCDLPGADVAANQLRGAVALRDAVPTPVLLASAATGSGISEVVAALDVAYDRHSAETGAARFVRRVSRMLVQRCARELREALQRDWSAVEILAARVIGGELALPEASSALLGQLGRARRASMPTATDCAGP